MEGFTFVQISDNIKKLIRGLNILQLRGKLWDGKSIGKI